MRNSLLIAGLAVFGSAATAQAGEPCRSAKDMVRMAQAFYAADADRVDIINPSVTLEVKGINGQPTPTQMRVRDDEQELYLDIGEDGFLQDIDKVATVSKDGEICRIIDGALAPATEGDSTSVSVGFTFPYRRTDGQFTIEEILEGAKDGSKVINGVAPGGMGFAVPGLKAIYLRPPEEGAAVPVARFTRKGESVTVPVSVLNGSQYVRTKDIKSSKADRLTITGGYILEAGFKFDPEELAEAEAKRLAELTAPTAE